MMHVSVIDQVIISVQYDHQSSVQKMSQGHNRNESWGRVTPASLWSVKHLASLHARGGAYHPIWGLRQKGSHSRLLFSAPCLVCALHIF